VDKSERDSLIPTVGSIGGLDRYRSFGTDVTARVKAGQDRQACQLTSSSLYRLHHGGTNPRPIGTGSHWNQPVQAAIGTSPRGETWKKRTTAS
jgi:hypothetical protein